MFKSGMLIHDEERGIWGIILCIDAINPSWHFSEVSIFVLATTPDSDFTAGAIEEGLSFNDETRAVTWSEVQVQIHAQA
jgi:hypothetical protein